MKGKLFWSPYQHSDNRTSWPSAKDAAWPVFPAVLLQPVVFLKCWVHAERGHICSSSWCCKELERYLPPCPASSLCRGKQGVAPAQTSCARCIILCQSCVCPWNKVINLWGSAVMADYTSQWQRRDTRRVSIHLPEVV